MPSRGRLHILGVATIAATAATTSATFNFILLSPLPVGMSLAAPSITILDEKEAFIVCTKGHALAIFLSYVVFLQAKLMIHFPATNKLSCIGQD